VILAFVVEVGWRFFALAIVLAVLALVAIAMKDDQDKGSNGEL
jgi:hypothetical protein